MRLLTLRVISFKQYADDPVSELYALNEDLPITMGCYFYNRELGKAACVQHCLHIDQTKKKYPVIEATTNLKYDLPRIPQSFVKTYWDSNKEFNQLTIRL